MGADRGMTAKQAAFVREYLVDLNGTQAAIRAGYSPATARQIADENLSKPAVREAVEAGKAARAAAVEITAETVLRGLLAEAQADDGPMCKGGRVKAWELIGKHLGMMTERSKLEVSGDVSGLLSVSLERYKRLAAESTPTQAE
jgi:phage terminase small subunit